MIVLTDDRHKLEQIRRRLQVGMFYGLAHDEVAYLVDLVERLEQVNRQLTDNLQMWMDEAGRLKAELEKYK